MSKPLPTGQRLDLMEKSIAEIRALLSPKEEKVAEVPVETKKAKAEKAKIKGMHKTKGILQSILIPKAKMTRKEANNWILSHSYKNYKVDTTDKYYRFRQTKPREGVEYFTLSLPSGIKLVMFDMKVKKP